MLSPRPMSSRTSRLGGVSPGQTRRASEIGGLMSYSMGPGYATGPSVASGSAPPALAAGLADGPAARADQLGLDLDEPTAADRAGCGRRLLLGLRRRLGWSFHRPVPLN